MFAKIFAQILDSTIAENYNNRHVFMDLLVLADIDGCVNATAEAIARKTNAPLDVVVRAIEFLSQPDEHSQNKECEGRRLVPIQEGRNWGWRIVSYAKYRAIRDSEQKREYNRDYYTSKKKKKPKRPKRKTVLDLPTHSGKRIIAANSPLLDPDRTGPQDGPPE